MLQTKRPDDSFANHPVFFVCRNNQKESVSFPGIKTDSRVLARNRGLELVIETVLRSTEFDKKSIMGKSPNLKVQV
ncbi:hypothetical protein ACTQ44_04300 [Ligilactobacillus ruminis]|uniref:hypothetical protein n=1 Tax=Ligilactobacillus ruminis TaxID=1623 RepID=UPI003F9B10A7|nr:hypothetical protein [Ligilactobacillus ruminis]MDD5958060.1 hypothetical protein [Ligilactobacillus ruminis]